MKQYIVELVTKESPYICLGYVKNDSITSNVLNFTGNIEDAIVVCNKETMGKVLELIYKHNKNGVRVMDWITEVGSKKRVFQGEISW
jgi:hypothetical protein